LQHAILDAAAAIEERPADHVEVAKTAAKV
jgi:hypothetical protein